MNIETVFNTSALKRFYFPGTMIWGSDCRDRLSDILGEDGPVALWVDRYFENSGYIETLRQHLGQRVVLFEVIAEMPATDTIDRMIHDLSKLDAPAPGHFVAIGGGSTIDTAKAVLAHKLYGTYDGVGMGENRGKSVLPMVRRPIFVCLPTTAGTGAESSRYYVTYRSGNRGKVHGKSWQLIADWILLDPAFLADSSLQLLAACAFDAFTHFFESFLCKGERSWFGDMLSVEGITRILKALNSILLEHHCSEICRTELLYAASLGGMAISNIRTGNIHEAAGALLEHSTLTHPETLFVFFRKAVEQYREAIADREELLISALERRAPEVAVHSVEDLITWWENAFTNLGMTTAIQCKLDAVQFSRDQIEQKILSRLHADRVWIEKESPAALSISDIEQMVRQSLTDFGFTDNPRRGADL